MNMMVKKWVRKITFSVATAVLVTSCANAATDFNQVGKYLSYRLQNLHFSKQEFSDDLSRKFLETYLRTADPNKIFFTQEDVDRLKEKYGEELDDYLLGEQTINAATELYDFYSSKVENRVEFARKLLEKDDFKFDRYEAIARSRRKVDWPKNEEELDQVWRDIVEEQLLSEILRRETIAQLAAEQDKPDPSAGEKSPKEKLELRYSRILRNIKEYSEPEDKANALLSAVARSFDPHTDYMGARETERFKDSMGGSLVGIGALLGEEDDGSTKITGIVVGGPADKSGELKLNDKIVGVDSEDTGEMTDIMYMKPDKVVEMIRGKAGTTVRLKVEPASDPSQVKIVSLVRRVVELKETYAKGEIIEMNGDDGKPVRLGILNLPSFYADMDGGGRRSATDVRRILERMVDEKVTGLVIDLRSNGGGSLEEVRLMTGFFIGNGPVVQVKDAKGYVDVKSAPPREPIFDGQIVVLINKASASASEILAAALQDYGRAIVVGDASTFGKGTVQQPDDIGRFLPFFADRSRAGLLKVTIQKFYRVAGGSTQLKGVESDIVLPSPTAAFEIGEEVLDYAMPYDQIKPAKGYEKDTWIAKALPELRERSQKRVAADLDLQILQEEIDRVKKRLDENKISLNRAERVKENTEMQERRKSINKERKVRFAEMAKKDAEKYKLYRLTLEDVDKPELVPADPEKDNDQFIKMADDPTEQLDDTPDYPSGLDPELREALNIVSDMVFFKQRDAVKISAK